MGEKQTKISTENWHRLADRDLEAKTATCSRCGPTKIVVKTRRERGDLSVRCANAVARDQRHAVVKMKYGLTVEDYALLLSVQDGLCAICGTPEVVNAALHVDHCHDSGQVRGLLCFNCNGGLGNFKDSPELLQKAIDYLDLYRVPLRVAVRPQADQQVRRNDARRKPRPVG